MIELKAFNQRMIKLDPEAYYAFESVWNDLVERQPNEVLRVAQAFYIRVFKAYQQTAKAQALYTVVRNLNSDYKKLKLGPQIGLFFRALCITESVLVDLHQHTKTGAYYVLPDIAMRTYQSRLDAGATELPDPYKIQQGDVMGPALSETGINRGLEAAVISPEVRNRQLIAQGIKPAELSESDRKL